MTAGRAFILMCFAACSAAKDAAVEASDGAAMAPDAACLASTPPTTLYLNPCANPPANFCLGDQPSTVFF